MFTIQMDEDEFRIVGPDGEEGGSVDYGEVATLAIGEAIYYALIDDPNGESPVVLRVDRVTQMPTDIEEVTFEEGSETAGGPVIVEASTELPE